MGEERNRSGISRMYIGMLDRWSEREQGSKVWEIASCWCQCSPTVKRVLKVKKTNKLRFKLKIEMYCLRS